MKKTRTYITKKLRIMTISIFSLLIPFQVLLAQAPQNFGQLVDNIIDVIDPLIILAIALAVLFFLYGVVRYLLQYGDAKARSESVKTISWGIIGLFAMVAMWGLVKLLQTTLVGGGSGVGIPQF